MAPVAFPCRPSPRFGPVSEGRWCSRRTACQQRRSAVGLKRVTGSHDVIANGPAGTFETARPAAPFTAWSMDPFSRGRGRLCGAWDAPVNIDGRVYAEITRASCAWARGRCRFRCRTRLSVGKSRVIMVNECRCVILTARTAQRMARLTGMVTEALQI